MEMSDARAMNKVFGDADVMRYGEGVKSEQWVLNWLLQNSDQTVKIASWAIDKKESGETIGYCGLFYYPDICGQPETEIGYRLARSFWGYGYATESARSIQNYAFNSLDLSRLIALIDPQNIASVHVVEKLGFSYEMDVMLEGYTHPDHVYTCANDGCIDIHK